MDYTGLAHPKGRPRKLEKADRLKVRVSKDEAESDKVKARSKGRCEVWTQVNRKVAWQCKRRAVHVHHMLGGNGVRGRGQSALKAHKQHVCTDCHSDIGAHVLVRIGGVVPLWTDRYSRVK
jgi:hypothetical protein